MYLLNETYNKIINISSLKQKVIDNIFLDINNSLKNICYQCGSYTLSDVLNIVIKLDNFLKKKMKHILIILKY